MDWWSEEKWQAAQKTEKGRRAKEVLDKVYSVCGFLGAALAAWVGWISFVEGPDAYSSRSVDPYPVLSAIDDERWDAPLFMNELTWSLIEGLDDGTGGIWQMHCADHPEVCSDGFPLGYHDPEDDYFDRYHGLPRLSIALRVPMVAPDPEIWRPVWTTELVIKSPSEKHTEDQESIKLADF